MTLVIALRRKIIPQAEVRNQESEFSPFMASDFDKTTPFLWNIAFQPKFPGLNYALSSRVSKTIAQQKLYKKGVEYG